MPGKIGLPPLLVACLLVLGAPLVADATPPDAIAPDDTAATTVADATSAPTSPDTSSSDSSTPETSSTETTTTVTGPDVSPIDTSADASSLDAGVPGFATGPARVSGQTSTRGPQVQLTAPPPSPFDPPVDGGNGRRVVYSKTQQTVWVYDDTNTIIKMHRVSGRQDPGDPLPGVYRVWSRSARTFAINNPSITWNYMIRFAKGDRGGNIGFHDIPYQYGRPVQTIDQLGQALSGGCVRQASEDAIWMWNWAQIGTVVVVTP